MARTDVLTTVYELVGTEIESILRSRDLTEARARDNTRQQVNALLLQASRQQDIDAMLALERVMLSAEKEYLGESPDKIASLDKALEELDAALASLASVRDQDNYRKIATLHYSLSKNQIGGLPNDQARQFLKSHQTRLRNLGKGRMEESERDLLSIRARNIKAAATVYKALQEQALGIKGKDRAGSENDRGR